MTIFRGPNIVRDGLVFGYDANDKSTRFYKGEPTTNLCTNFTNIYTNWDNSGVLTINTNDTTLDRLFTDINIFSGTVAAVGNQQISPGGCDISPNTTYSLSLYLFINGNTTFQSQPYIRPWPDNIWAGSLAYNGSTNWSTWPKNEWIRLEGTFTASSTATSVYISSYIGDAVGHKIYYTAPQIEQKTHVTQFVNGTRSSTNSLIDLKKTRTLDLSNVSFDSTAHPIFDGTNDYIDTGYDLSWNDTNSVTIDLWVKPDIASQNAGIIGKPNPTWEWVIKHENTSLIFIYWDVDGSHSNGDVITLKNFFDANIWHNITLVWSHINNNIVIYKNGQIINTTGWIDASRNQNRTNNVYLGGNIYSWNVGYWLGTIKKVVFYNNALTFSEVLQNYNVHKNRFGL